MPWGIKMITGVDLQTLQRNEKTNNHHQLQPRFQTSGSRPLQPQIVRGLRITPILRILRALRFLGALRTPRALRISGLKELSSMVVSYIFGIKGDLPSMVRMKVLYGESYNFGKCSLENRINLRTPTWGVPIRHALLAQTAPPVAGPMGESDGMPLDGFPLES